MRLGLDWDGTITSYAAELALLARVASVVFVITLNEGLTAELVAREIVTPVDDIRIVVCPSNARHYYDIWKAETCLGEKIDLMVDDDPRVAEACWERGVKALLVARHPWRESRGKT